VAVWMIVKHVSVDIFVYRAYSGRMLKRLIIAVALVCAVYIQFLVHVTYAGFRII
jgi:hypothetical protein